MHQVRHFHRQPGRCVNHTGEQVWIFDGGMACIADVVAGAVRAFEDAGAHVEPVKFGLKRSQRELSDAWTRLMMPLNLGAFAAVKAAGLDLLGDHADDFPSEYSAGSRSGSR